MTDGRLCSRCVLPETEPAIRIGDDGLCSVCVAHDQAEKTAVREDPPETDLLKLLKKHRGKGEYDCLVMCSGGKDSTSALWYMKKRYRMSPLAFTFDNGFEAEGALRNVGRAVEILGVDHLQFRTQEMHEMLRRLLETGSRAVICHLCSLWYMDLTFRLAARFRIPIIVAGWTKGQCSGEARPGRCLDDSSPEFGEMAEATREFLRSVREIPEYRSFPRSMDEVLRRARKRFRSVVISPHWFLPTEAEEYVRLLEKELDWRPIPSSYPKNSTNCLLNFVSVHNSMRFYGYTHYHVEMSKMIRQGLMTRDEALDLLQVDFDIPFLNTIVGKLDYEFAEE